MCPWDIRYRVHQRKGGRFNLYKISNAKIKQQRQTTLGTKNTSAFNVYIFSNLRHFHTYI